MTELPEMTQGNSEPASSTAVWTMSLVGVLSFIILYGVLYPGHPFPGLSDILPLFSALGNSLVWFFISGVILGLGMLVAMLVGESIAE
ncbi:MAG TPA: hypothetical protein QF802_01060 [Candidatus Thalassarchaeaceae archaeon]|jgi:hypothetical protein|nr:hypothetical protein [Candidatus Thalassarchaeaceae archaeon]HJL59881.1 hypothetical protein [Candidatus Thalassarchaeaceae archaeon]HJM19030.1 hypothetical protein [Candidatus Thalassarchaeaceae archaeon]HJM87815.1 hypothetical protein [Candidatus Thalassarchaeaceae archaeon]